MIRKTSSSVLLRSSIISIRPCQGQERSPIERIPTFEDDDKKREDFTTRAKNIKPDPVIPHLQKNPKLWVAREAKNLAVSRVWEWPQFSCLNRCLDPSSFVGRRALIIDA